MRDQLRLLGNIAGILGVLACLLGGIARLAGYYYIGPFEAISVFNLGTALMIFACLVKLHLLTDSGI